MIIQILLLSNQIWSAILYSLKTSDNDFNKYNCKDITIHITMSGKRRNKKNCISFFT